MENLAYQQFWLVSVIILGAALIPTIFYLLTLQRALQTVSRENRKMEPGLVWLLIIPLFKWVWYFFVTDALGTSFQREYQKYGVFQSEKPTYGLGLTLAILECCFIIPLLNVLAIFGAFVIWIIYWVKVNEVKNDLVNLQNNSRLDPNQTSIFL